MAVVRVPLTWQVGHSTSAEVAPEQSVPATVPGAVQLDWARAHNWPPYWQCENYRQYRWMEDAFWTYRAALPQVPQGKSIALVIGGVDYAFDILLNGRILYSQEGMQTPARVELTGRYNEGDELLVRIHPAPKSQKEPDNRDQANRSCKPAVSYQWDFHPRLIPLGIWQDAYIEVGNGYDLSDVQVRYELADDFSSARLQLTGGWIDKARWELLDPAGKTVLHGTEPTATISNPILWWPHDHGTPALYTLRLTIDDDTVEKRIGFRRVRLVMHEGAWNWPDKFPKGPSNAPITLEVNGRRIFVKGSNWVSPDIFPGILDRSRYEPLVKIARDANLNAFRMWGGAPAQKEAFYELCDELGMMIWQEFPLGCNCYPDDPTYLAVLEQESRSMIRRLTQHPCLVLFCGGNELFNSWSRMTEQSHALRLLDRNCFDLAREIPFLKTSPIMGMGHGSYGFQQKEGEIWSVFQNSSFTAYTEFGCGAPSPRELLEEVRPPEQLRWLWTQEGTAPMKEICIHMAPDMQARYFGKCESLQQWIDRGQLLQAEGLKGAFEEVRRQKPKAAMAINWCFNEPWPNVANLSIVAYPARPKPAIAAIGQACRPVLASARIPHFQWKAGELFEAELWMLSDRHEIVPGGQMKASLVIDGKAIPLLTWDFGDLGPNRNLRGPKAQYVLPEIAGELFELVLEIAGRPELNSRYRLGVRRS